MKKNIETIILWFLVVWFGLIAVNVNQTLGLIYLAAFTLGTIFYLKEDTKRTIPFSKNGNWLFAIFQAILIYAGFVFFASIIMPYFQKIPIGKLLQLIATTSPALAESQILNTISFVFAIPFIETVFFIVSFDYLATQFNIDISRRGLFKFSTYFMIAIFSFLFLLYHTNAKGLTNNAALLLVFLMMFVTLFFAVFFQESKQVIFYHCFANFIGMGFLGILTTGVVSLLIFIKLIKPKKIIKL